MLLFTLLQLVLKVWKMYRSTEVTVHFGFPTFVPIMVQFVFLPQIDCGVYKHIKYVTAIDVFVRTQCSLMRWVENIARVVEIRNAHTVLNWKPKWKSLQGVPRYSHKDDIKWFLQKLLCKSVTWIGPNVGFLWTK